MRISQLEGQRVALWGWGREGRAAYRAIRAALPALPLALFCTPSEVDDAQALGDAQLEIDTRTDAGRLSAFDIVIKSPGISPYRPDAAEATVRGTRFVGGTALWFAQHAGPDGIAARTVCVTGTKGKSTTTALLAHLLRSGGHVTALAGNIGLPLLELPEHPVPEAWVIELSSYQTGDVADSGTRPDIAVVTNIFPEHLDWHGSQTRYVEDKLRLVTGARPRIAVLNADDPTVAALGHAIQADPASTTAVRWYGTRDGWYLRGDVLWRGAVEVLDTAGLPLPGRHNRGNLCAVLTAIEALGHDAVALAPNAVHFQPLPHRLQVLGERDGVTYVNDSISTTPFATLAALDCHRDRPVALLVGGHDRGVDWAEFARDVGTRAPAVIVTMGANGPRIHAELEAVGGDIKLLAANDLADAVVKARQSLPAGGVVLLSPGAPSFGPYRDYVERGRHFASIAGFDPDTISSIPGLGIH